MGRKVLVKGHAVGSRAKDAELNGGAATEVPVVAVAHAVLSVHNVAGRVDDWQLRVNGRVVGHGKDEGMLQEGGINAGSVFVGEPVHGQANVSKGTPEAKEDKGGGVGLGRHLVAPDDNLGDAQLVLH